MKKLLCVVASFVIAMGVMSWSAEAAGGKGGKGGGADKKAARQAGKAGKGAGAAGQDGKGGRVPPKQAIDQLQEATAKLNLTDDQKTKVTGFLDDARAKFKEIREADKGDKQKAKEETRTLMQNTRDSIMSVLTDDQKTQFKELVKESRTNRRTGADGPATAPTTAPADAKPAA